jgi:methylisocitrate lyase
MLTNSKGAAVADEERAGADVVLYYGLCLYAAYWGIKQALQEFQHERDFDAMSRISGNTDEFERLMGYEQFAARARTYGLV